MNKSLIKILLLLLTFLIPLSSGCSRIVEPEFEDDILPPGVPQGVFIYSAGDGEIIVAWNRSLENDFKEYRVYRSIDSISFTKIDVTTSDYYWDDSLEYNITYYYQITAADRSGNESKPSKIVSAMPVNKNNPLKPRFVEINGRNWEGEVYIHLNWEKSFDTDVAGYNIYKSESPAFDADSLSLSGFSVSNEFNDTDSGLQLYKKYYYKIRAVDKGGLLSDPTNAVSDMILGTAEGIFPGNNSNVDYFSNFKILTIDIPAKYKIVVQENPFFGEFWSSTFNSSITNDTINVSFNPSYLYANTYYWRIITLTGNKPNSISTLYKFTIKP